MNLLTSICCVSLTLLLTGCQHVAVHPTEEEHYKEPQKVTKTIVETNNRILTGRASAQTKIKQSRIIYSYKLGKYRSNVDLIENYAPAGELVDSIETKTMLDEHSDLKMVTKTYALLANKWVKEEYSSQMELEAKSLFESNNQGQIVSKITIRSNREPEVIFYDYDEQNRLIALSSESDISTEHFSYNDINQLITYQTTDSQINYVYDHNNRLIQLLDTNSKKIIKEFSEFDDYGNWIEAKFASGAIEKRTLDYYE